MGLGNRDTGGRGWLKYPSTWMANVQHEEGQRISTLQQSWCDTHAPKEANQLSARPQLQYLQNGTTNYECTVSAVSAAGCVCRKDVVSIPNAV